MTWEITSYNQIQSNDVFVFRRQELQHTAHGEETWPSEQCLPQVIMTWDCVTATVLTYKHVNYSTYCRDQLLSPRQGQHWGRNKHNTLNMAQIYFYVVLKHLNLVWIKHIERIPQQCKYLLKHSIRILITWTAKWAADETIVGLAPFLTLFHTN